MQNTSFGMWLRQQRKALDLTREELARQVGYSAATIRKIEAEERRPSAQLVERLAEIFNLPNSELAGFQKFARGDWLSAPDKSRMVMPWQATKVHPSNNLPTTITSLVGREQDVAIVVDYLLNEEIRLVTLIGPLGVGKTRLSLQTARQVLPAFPDGVFFVPLAPLENAEFAAAAAIQALGYVETRQCPAIDQLIEGISDKKMLLILDNCEHLIEGIAPMSAALLLACPNLKLLTTSREALRVPGEWLYNVPALKTPTVDLSVDPEAAEEYSALTLFSERARAVRGDFCLDTGNLPAVGAICSRVDGLPLAIELIAASVRLMSPQSLLERMNDQFILSVDGIRGVPARQKTLQNAINWSYTLLSPDEKRMFACLAVFAGSFSLANVEAIFSPLFTARQAAKLVASLIDKSLVQRILDAHAEPRFYMLFTIKQFALSLLREQGDEKKLRELHLAYTLGKVEQADGEFHGPNQLKWIDWVETEHDNVRAALEWCVTAQKAEAGLRLMGALGWPCEVRNNYRGMRIWFERMCSLPEANNYTAYYARLLNHIGRYSWTLWDLADARALLEKSQAMLAELGAEGEREMAEGLNWLGMVTLAEGQDPKAAEACFSRSYQLFQKWDDPRSAVSLFHLGIVEIERGNTSLALARLEESRQRFLQMEDLFFIARVTVFLGQLYRKQGELEKAAEYYEACLAIDRQIRFWNEITSDLRELGDIYRRLGRYEQAEQNYAESLALCREHGLGPCTQWFSLGLLALQQDDEILAGQYFLQPGDLEQLPAGTPGLMLSGLAAVAAKMGLAERAARLHGAAQAMLKADNYQLRPDEQAEVEGYIQAARGQLGDEAFEALETEGSVMSLGQAVAYVRETIIYPPPQE